MERRALNWFTVRSTDTLRNQKQVAPQGGKLAPEIAVVSDDCCFGDNSHTFTIWGV